MFGNFNCRNRALPHKLLVQTLMFRVYPDGSMVCKTVSRGGEETCVACSRISRTQKQYFKNGNGIGF